MQEFYACGKLLLSGEYLVLRGAEALAVPTRYGQKLVYEAESENIHWQSIDKDGNCWLEVEISPRLEVLYSSEPGSEKFLLDLLRAGSELGKNTLPGGRLEARLEFDRNWGLGSSSSLTHLIAQWLEVDPMKLFFATQNGSGYDVAIAGACAPIVYSLSNQNSAHWHRCKLPSVLEHSHFVYLNQKQKSDVEVKNFSTKKVDPEHIEQISSITRKLIEVQQGGAAEALLQQHEEILSKILQVPTVKERLFPDFPGSLKSLGAWGGDFIWAFGENTREYFTNKGYNTIYSYQDLILK